jgi:hypothetical protein
MTQEIILNDWVITEDTSIDENGIIKPETVTPEKVSTDLPVSNSETGPIEINLNDWKPTAPVDSKKTEVTSKDDLEDQTELALETPPEYDERIMERFNAEQIIIGKESDEDADADLDYALERQAQARAIEQTNRMVDEDGPTDYYPRPSTFEVDKLFRQTETRLAKHEELRDSIQAMLNDPNPVRAESVDGLLNAVSPVTLPLTDIKAGEPFTLNQIGWILGLAEWTPFYGTGLALIDIPENFKVSKELWNEGHEIAAVSILGLSAVELVASGYGAKAIVKKATDKVRSKGRKKIDGIRIATDADLEKKMVKAENLVDDNREITDQFIKEYELSIDPTGNTKISKVVDGKLVLDEEAARRVGLDMSEDVYELQRDYMEQFVEAVKAKDQKKILELEQKTGISANQILAISEDNADGFISPLLRAESFNSVLAVAVDLKKKFPKAFDNDKTVIDNLFELTVSDKFDADDLADTLAEYGLNFDQYVLTVVGSGSEAGKILNKLSQIKRAGTLKIDAVKTNELERTQNGIVSAWRRLENIRRGSMTSMLKTAMRNFQSAGIRAPMEAIENVADTVLLSMSNEFNKKSDQMLIRKSLRASAAGIQTFVSPSQWAGSLAPLKRIYATPGLSKDITELILDRPEFVDKHTALFDNVNEYRKRTGAGSGGPVDGVLSAAESVVDVLSIPNRIQEYVIRRGVFTGELERLLKRDWGVNMMEALESGKLNDMIANASSVRPKGAPSFEELLEMSTKRALDVTYAKAPDVPLFKETANFLSRTGLTAVTTPFPRFMFNSIELMGQYSGGAFNPAIKRALGKKSGPLDAKDRQNISRNLSGLVAITAAYQYRTSKGAPADYKQIDGQDVGTGEDTVIDVTAQYPMRQFLWIAEAMKRLDPNIQQYLPVSGPLTAVGIAGDGDATFDDWFDGKDAIETFLGTGARTGATNVFVDEIAEILGGGGDDIVFDQRSKKVVGRLLGDYLRTHLIPVTQVVEIQRMLGKRPVEYKDYSTDEPFTVGGQIERSLDQSGVTSILNPEDESKIPSREFVLAPERERVGLGLSLFGGISVLQKNNEDAEYLVGKGITEYDLMSRGKGSVRREENELMREEMPFIVDTAREVELEARKNYMKESSKYKKNYTLEEHINAEVVAVIKTMVKTTRANLIGPLKYDNAPTWVEPYNKFKRQSRDLRRYATREFLKEYGEPPNQTNEDDMLDLLDFIKDLDEYKVGKPTVGGKLR